MKLSMLRLWIASVLLSNALFGFGFGNSIDEKLTNFFLNMVRDINARGGNFHVKEIQIRGKKDLKEIPGWKVYFVDIKLDDMTIHEKVFTNGKYISKDFIDIDNPRASLKSQINMDIQDDKVYNKEHLLYGTGDEPHKIIAISDPVCPFCQEVMPKLLRAVKEHPGKAALYYYHMPLTKIHPAADVLSRLMIAAKQKGIKDVELKVYENKDYFNAEDKEDKVIRTFNKLFNTNFTKKDLYTKQIDQKVKEDKEYTDFMMVNATPTIFVDGKKDVTRTKYKEILGIK